MREDAHEFLKSSLPAIAARMRALNATVLAANLGERKHLLPATADALDTAAAGQRVTISLTTEHPFQTADWESRAGVDIGIRGLPGLAPVFCELKWGDGARVLGECSWDLAKMGLAVAKGACSAAVLLAGAPVARWTSSAIEGPELFADATHTLAHVRGPLYRDRHWQKYADEGRPQPKRLPAAYRTVPLGSELMRLDDGRDWELRCLEIISAGELVAIDPLPTSAT